MTPFSCDSINGVIETGSEARTWMLWERTLKATGSASSYPMKTLIMF
jgi:hypothetical protein